MNRTFIRLPLAAALGLVLMGPAIAQTVYNSTTATGQATTTTGTTTSTGQVAPVQQGTSVTTTGQLGANVSSGTTNPNTTDSTAPDPNITGYSNTEVRPPVTQPVPGQTDTTPDDYYTGTTRELHGNSDIQPTIRNGVSSGASSSTSTGGSSGN